MAKRGIRPSDGVKRPFDMTKEQYNFALLIMKGMTQWQAYMQVYDCTVSKKDAERRGCAIAKSKRVRQYMESKKQEALEIKAVEEKTIWEWNDALKFLTDVASGKHKETKYGHGGYSYKVDVDTRTRIKAIEVMSDLWKMTQELKNGNTSTVTVNVINEANTIEQSLRAKLAENTDEDLIIPVDGVDISDVQ